MNNSEITKEELKNFLESYGILQEGRIIKMTQLVLFFFRIVPAGKYISKGFIVEVLKEWGFYCRGNSADITNTLGKLARDRGWLKKIDFDEYEKRTPEEKRMRFCKKYVLPPVRIIGGGYTRSVFQLSSKGKRRIRLLLEVI